MRFDGAIADIELSVRIMDANRYAVIARRQEGDADAMKAEIEAREEAVRILKAAGGAPVGKERSRC